MPGRSVVGNMINRFPFLQSVMIAAHGCVRERIPQKHAFQNHTHGVLGRSALFLKRRVRKKQKTEQKSSDYSASFAAAAWYKRFDFLVLLLNPLFPSLHAPFWKDTMTFGNGNGGTSVSYCGAESEAALRAESRFVHVSNLR